MSAINTIAPREKLKRKNPAEYEQRLVDFQEMRQKERDKRLEKIESKKRELKERRMTMSSHGNHEPTSSNMKFNTTEVGRRATTKSVATDSKPPRPLLSRFSSAVAIQLVTTKNSNNNASHKNTAVNYPSSRSEIEKSTTKPPPSSYPARSVRPIVVPVRSKSLAIRSTMLGAAEITMPSTTAKQKENSGIETDLKEIPRTPSPRKTLKSAVVPLATSDEVNQNVALDAVIEDEETNEGGRRASFTIISLKRKFDDPKTPVDMPKQAKFEIQSPTETATKAVITTEPIDMVVNKVVNNKIMAEKRLSRLNQLSVWREQRKLKLKEAKSTAASKSSNAATHPTKSAAICRTMPVIPESSRKPPSKIPNVKSEVVAIPEKLPALSTTVEPVASVQFVKPVSTLKGVQSTRNVLPLRKSSTVVDVKRVAVKTTVSQPPSSRVVKRSSRAAEIPTANTKDFLKPSVLKVVAKKVAGLDLKDVVSKKKVSTTSVTNPRTRFKGALADINATAARFKAAQASRDAPHRFSPRRRPGTLHGPNTSTPFCYDGKRVGVTNITTPWTNFKTPGAPGTKPLTSTRVEKTPGGMRWTIKTPATRRRTQNVSSDKVLRENLEKWLTAHGKAASTFRHVGCFGLHGHQLEQSAVPVVPQKLSLDSSIENGPSQSNLGATEVLPAIVESGESSRGESGDKFQTDLLEMLRECLSLMQSGFPSHHLLTWLDDISSKITGVRRTACFWTSKARLTAAAQPDDLAAALSVLEEGIACKAEPLEELLLAREELVLQTNIGPQNELLEMITSNNLYQRIAAEVQQKNAFQSSAIKFCMKRMDSAEMPVCTPQKTPVARRRTVAFPTTPSTPSRQNNIVTPVRRSTRKSCMQLPVGLRDHDVIIESLDELTIEAREALKFNKNVALPHDLAFDANDADASGIALL